ncbi:sca1 complex scaffold protein scaa [Anaeramoeba flamelloides]|uniref:Sca1 complex scaffold protein scaa n=1 Tax=Anaeramoeba flamelloides TaxID=1746091 RepID=A0ABQ8X764_9EUKA|nr:sca1 complex scaffold protein scaa [Anaeramoeba flamelloides]
MNIRSYLGPPITINKIPPSPKELYQNTHFPFYLGTDGKLFDKYYLPIQKQQTYFSFNGNQEKDLKKENSQIDPLKQYSTIKPTKLPPFPNPDSFKNYKEFEIGALKWGQMVENKLGYLQLPDIIGTDYSRPVLNIPNKNFHTEDTDWDLITNDGEDYDEDPSFYGDSSWTTQQLHIEMEESDFISPNQEKALYDYLSQANNELETNQNDQNKQNIKKWLKENEQWSSQLIPQEPKPNYYETFEEFERAYRRWYLIISKNIEQIPMHPLQLKKQINLMPSINKTKKIKSNSISTIYNIRKNEKDSKTLINSKTEDSIFQHISWKNTQIQTSPNLEKFLPDISKDISKPPDPLQKRRRVTRVQSSNTKILEYHIKTMKQEKKEEIEKSKKKDIKPFVYKYKGDFISTNFSSFNQ